MTSLVEILSKPQLVGADNLIVAISVLNQAGIDPPFWTYQMWAALDTGNARTWTEFSEDLYADADHFGARVAKIKEQIAPILAEVEPLTEEESQKIISKYETRQRQIRAEGMFKMKEKILTSGVDPKQLTDLMKAGLGELTPEEEEFIKQLTSGLGSGPDPPS